MRESIKPAVTLYTRPGCHLCDDARVVLEEVQRERAFDLTIVDVDTDPKLAELYGLEVPVVFIDGEKAFVYRVDASTLRSRLCV